MKQGNAQKVLASKLIGTLNLPDMFAEELELEFMEDKDEEDDKSIVRSNEEEEGVQPNVTKKRKKDYEYRPREHIPRKPKEVSSWYQKHLAPDKRLLVQRGESDPNSNAAERKLAKQFTNTFRVYWTVFDRKFHDPSRKD